MEPAQNQTVAKGGKVWTLPSAKEPEVIRLSVNINDETAAALRKLSADKGITITEVMRRAIAVTHFLYDQEDQGKIIQTVSRKGKVRNVILPR